MDLVHYRPQKEFAQAHMLRIQDYAKDELLAVLSLAMRLKEERGKGVPHPLLRGKTLAMIFSKSSTRTRVSFETGMYQLGGMALFLSAADIQLGRGETIADTARTLSRMVDGIMIRTFAQSDVEDLARYGSIPVINGLTDHCHPCQALADLMTLYERKGGFEGRKLAYVGDGNNVAHSLTALCSKLGVDIALACPEAYLPDESVLALARGNAADSGAQVVLTQDPFEAAEGADAVYTDVWASMGQERQAKEKYGAFEGFQVNGALMRRAKKDAVFLHCLPAHRGEEVSEDVIDGPQSAVFDQAENRLHVQKALLALLMKGGA